MAKYRVTLSDGRHLDVYADDPESVKPQALHQEQTRLIFAAKHNFPLDPPYAIPVSVEEI